MGSGLQFTAISMPSPRYAGHMHQGQLVENFFEQHMKQWLKTQVESVVLIIQPHKDGQKAGWSEFGCI